MTRIDMDQADRDSFADDRRERDRHREPLSLHRTRWARPVARQVFQASVVDSVNIAKAARDARATTRLVCPTCRGSVYVPRDSDLERVECLSCESVFTTHRTIDGVGLRIRDDKPITTRPGGAR